MKMCKVIEHNRYQRNAIIASLIAGIATFIAIREKSKCDKCKGIELLGDALWEANPDEMDTIWDACKKVHITKRVK